MMHEYGLVGQLIERASAEARARGASRIKRVTVSVGALAGVDAELLVRAWDTFRERTLCEGAPLVVNPVPARWTCPSCGVEIPSGALLRCPTCALPATLSAGGDLILDRLELEVPDV
jgi:hydrogenase nickel incorporation protein HypA/HybF